MINITLEKRDLWILSAIIVFLAGVVYVIALDSRDYLTMGHTHDELEPCPDGKILKMSGATWTCQDDLDTVGTGGMYVRCCDNSCVVSNPKTGSCSCPAGFSATSISMSIGLTACGGPPCGTQGTVYNCF